MNIVDRINNFIRLLLDNIHKRRKVVLALSCIVVFVTTYVLILPAFTLEKDKAASQGGIDVPSVEAQGTADIEIDAAEPNEHTVQADQVERKDPSDVDVEIPGNSDTEDKHAENKTEEHKASDNPETINTDPLLFEGEGFSVSIEDKESVLPADTELAVEELLEYPEGVTAVEARKAKELYDDYYSKTLDAVNETAQETGSKNADDQNDKSISFVRFYDITLLAEGESFQPESPIGVTITYEETLQKEMKVDSDRGDVRIVHFAEDSKTGEITAEVLDSKDVAVELEKDHMTEASFEAESFSVYAVVYTVDFSYVSDTDGKTYEYSISGGEGIGLIELLPALGVVKDDPDTGEDEVGRFVSQIDKAEFSTPSLVSVSKVDSDTTVGEIKDALELECEYSSELTEEQIIDINAKEILNGDWALISMKPFTSEETLTITMENGDVFVIVVTDASYSTNKVTDLNGKTVALVNLTNHNAMESTAHRGTGVGHLNAIEITYNASTNTVTTTDPHVVLSKWTFERVNGYNDRYYISSPNGYLNINGASLTVSPNRQALQVQQKSDGTIRIKHPNNNYAVNNDNNSTANGYDAYESTWDANPGEWFTAFEIGAGSGMIALNPMNENGVLGYWNHTSTSYKEMKIDGVTVDDQHLQNSRMFIPVNYNNNGTATITLPSHNQLGSFSVSSADPNTHSIEQNPNKYQWVLKGWVNIATGEYYDVSSGPATATVNQDDLNVFYADWWAADYDRELSDYIETADTSSFATIKVYDYNELFNLTSSTAWSVDHDNNQFIPRTTLDSEEWYITQVNGHQGDYFQFVDNTDSSNCWQYGTLGNQQGRSGGNEWSNYSNSGSLGILGTQGQAPSTGVLESLFPDTVTAGSGVNYLGESNYLFSYDPATKVYSYDSSLNGAVYSQSEERFYVADEPKTHMTSVWHPPEQGGTKIEPRTGFLPLNDYDQQLQFNDGTTNYWLGMSIDLDFWLPDTPGSSSNANLVTNTATGQKNHMRFDFTGDDDVWVLIDGKLALDIGGIHEAVGGYIDFSSGVIRNAKGNTYQLSDMGIGAGAHTLSFYYLERGGNASNCKITFNISPRWEEEPERYGRVSTTKTWTEDTPEEAKQWLSFSLETSDGTPIEGSTVGYADGTEDADHVWSYTWDGLDPTEDYVVIEQADPRFEITSRHETDVIENCWAAASYHKDNAFGSPTILIGNDKTSSEGGKLLNGSGGMDNADFVDHVVKSPDPVGNNDKWTVEGYNSTNQHFYLKNSAGQYLSIRNGSITFVNNSSDASWFYMSPSGDLNDANSDNRLLVNGSGIGVGPIVNSADETNINSPDRVHIYTYFDGTFSKSTDYEFENEYQTTEVTVVKAWNDSPRVNHDSDTITIALYQYAIDSNGQIVAEVEYPITSPNTDTITGNGTNTISDLPVAGVFEGQIVTYEYHVAEKSGKEGYIAQVDHPDEDFEHWTITNIAPDEQDKTTSVNLTKHWKHPDGISDADSDHENDVITFKLLQRAVESDFVPVTMRWVNNLGGVIEENFYIRKGENFSFAASKPGSLIIPHGVAITTTRGAGDSVNWNTTASGTRTFTISEINDAITINARLTFYGEEWGNRASYFELTWGHSVQTSDDVRTDINTVVASDEENDTADGYPAEYLYTLHKDEINDGVFDESASNWVATLADLPLYKKISDGTYYSYYYTFSEISVNDEPVLPNSTTTTGHSEDFTVVIDQENMTITNTEKEKTDAYADKTWLNVDGSNTPPDGASVIFELYADGEPTGKTVTLNGIKDVAEDPGDSEETIEVAGNSEHAYESAAWKAYWDNLQKYTYNEDGIRTDHEIVYSIREVTYSIPDGYTADYGKDGETPKTEADSGDIITNKQLEYELNILKVDKIEQLSVLKGAKFSIRKLVGNNASTMETDTSFQVQTATTGDDGKAQFTKLIMGVYEISETDLPAGYILSDFDGKAYIRINSNGSMVLLKSQTGTAPDDWSYLSDSDTDAEYLNLNSSTVTLTVMNEPGVELPHTGGIGTTVFYVFGSILVIGCGVYFISRRRVGSR